MTLRPRSGYVGLVKTATISYTKNHLSQLLEQVKRGETVTILDRDTPVARITPIPTTGNTDWDRKLDDLERRGIVRRGTGKIPDWILREAPPSTTAGTNLVDLIREDRDARP